MNVCIDMFQAFGVTYVWEHVSVQGCVDVRNHQQLSHLLHWVRVPESNPEFTDRPSLAIVCCGNFLSLPSGAGIPGGMLHSFVIYVRSRIQTLILMFVREILYLSSWFSKSTVDWSLFFRYMNLLREKNILVYYSYYRALMCVVDFQIVLGEWINTEISWVGQTKYASLEEKQNKMLGYTFFL